MKSEMKEKLKYAAHAAGFEGVPWSEAVDILRLAWAKGALAAHDGNVSATARKVHSHRNTISRILREQK